MTNIDHKYIALDQTYNRVWIRKKYVIWKKLRSQHQKALAYFSFTFYKKYFLNWSKEIQPKGPFRGQAPLPAMFKKKIMCSVSVLCSPRLILTRSPQISGWNKSEARELEGLVKITYGIVASSLFKGAGNSN